MGKPSVFISYSREDLKSAIQLEQALKEAGLETWRDQESLYAGQQWPKALGEAISSNDYILLLWSKNSSDSHFVEFEWTTAIALRKTIVPCMLDDTPLVPALISFNGIPLQDIASAVPRILNTIQVIKPGGGDKKQKASVLKALQEVVPDQPENMARAGTLMISRTLKGEPSSAASSAPASMRSSQVQFEDMTIGERYQVVKMLGRGGMGAVYQVYDTELERDAALKVIRSDMAEEPTVIQRFKREIQLSSQVTHRNVLRVYDLGEADGVKFLTMQYVEGEELTDILAREGKLPKERILRFLRQMADGLAAAHEKGVVHRDLKPANILIDKNDQVFITDFGLATTQAQSGLTQAGDVMGTPHYMSPEQVKGEPADPQSDIYSLGVILYEMATGQLPFSGNTIYEIMMQRTVKDPEPAKKLNSELPDFLDKIILGCMARDRAARYASIAELLEDLEEGALSGQTIMMTRLKMRSIRRKASLLTWKKLAIAVPLLILVLLGGWAVVDQLIPTSEEELAMNSAREPVSVLIADFENESEESVFSGGLLEQTLGTALEGASFVTTYNRGRARRIAGQLQDGQEALTEEAARLVAQREGIAVVVSGSLSREGDSFVLAVRAVDTVTGEEIEADTVTVDERDNVLTGIGGLAASVRRTLGDSSPESAQLIAAETFSASSFEAAQAYSQGQELFGAGNFEAAIEPYQRAIALDPQMGRAYASLAVSYFNLERREEAEEQFQLAMRNMERMSERERLRTRGGYFVQAGNYDKAIDELTSLVEQYPADFTGYGNLALAHFYSRQMDEALDAAGKASAIYPNNIVIRSNKAFYAMYAGDFDTAVREARSIIDDDPQYGFNYVCLALSELARGNAGAAAEVYGELRDLGGIDSTFANMGLSDIALYQGRYSEAAELLREGIEADLQNEDQPGAWRKSLQLAGVKLKLGRASEAAEMAAPILEATRHYPLVYEAALRMTDSGQSDRALAVATELKNQLKEESRLYGNLIEGEIRLRTGEILPALESFKAAQELSDSWLGRYGLGRAYLAGEAYAEADSEFEQCLNRKGEATAVFLDDMPSYHYFPPVLYYRGRAQEGLFSSSAKGTYQAFLEIKKDSEPDPMVDDARRRLADLGQ